MRISRGGSPRQHNAQARIASRAAPKDLVNILAKPAIRRPQMVPVHGGERDFGCQSQKIGAVPRAPLYYIGFRPPIQAPTVHQAPGRALSRVDVSNRDLGNKASKYDTERLCHLRPKAPAASGQQSPRGFAAAIGAAQL